MAENFNLNAPKNGQSPEKPTVMERFRALPRPAQLAVGGVALVVLYVLFSGRGNEAPPPLPQGAVNSTTVQDLQNQQNQPAGEQGVFSGLQTDRQALVQSWLEQNRREMSQLKDEIQNRFVERDQALTQALQNNAELQREMRQMMADFTAEIKAMQTSNARDRELINQLTLETQRIQDNASTDGSTQIIDGGRRERISQNPLAVSRLQVGGENALLGRLSGAASSSGGAAGSVPQSEVDNLNAQKEEKEQLPFLPPLGFVRATLLNGVDALVGGQPTPALARMHGVYRTAMNSTVKLDGCFMLIEFQGEISTERAIGKPSRMTCVYPDRGAVTYGVSGYVVDAEDGIIGMPGIFYEGDASRLAAAFLADFAAGVAQIIEQNQNTTTTTTDSNGTTQTNLLTGSEAKAEIAGGSSNLAQSLSSYLMERASRVVPFVRIDTTRDLHLVLLSGVELREEGSAWTLLFSADGSTGG